MWIVLLSDTSAKLPHFVTLLFFVWSSCGFSEKLLYLTHNRQNVDYLVISISKVSYLI